MQGELLAGRFRIGERLGVGAMGEVWAAQDERMRRAVAVKLVRAPSAEEAETQARFEREVQLAGRLSHQNIVTVHDWGEETIGGRRTLYVVMELVPGVSLRQRLKEARPAWPLAVGWAMQIARALHAAHSRDVVHRDIKPANVLITPEGTAKVLDFGVAKFVGDTWTVSELTVPGTVFGSPQYMSPEQAEGVREVDHRSDLYSLGCLLYHAVTGRPPFTGTSAPAVLRMHTQDTPVPPGDLVEGLPGALNDLITSLLAKRPEDRLSDADAVHTALSTLLVDHVATLPGENPLDIVQLGHADPLTGRMVERARHVWLAAERYSTSMRREADAVLERSRADALRVVERLHAEAAETLAAAQEEAVRRRREAEELLRSARKETEPLIAPKDGSDLLTGPEAGELVRTPRDIHLLLDPDEDAPVELARREADALLVGAREDAAAIRERAEEFRRRVEAEVETLHERARQESAEQMRSVVERGEKLLRAAEERLAGASAEAGQLVAEANSEASKVRINAVKKAEGLLKEAEEQHAEAEAKAGQLVAEANSEAGRVRINAVKKAEGLLKEAENKKSELIGQAEELKAEAARDAVRMVEQGKRELEPLLRRRVNIEAEISRVQDVLKALESYEPRPVGQDG